MFLNRCAIVLTPLEPYITWANGLEEGGPKFDDTRDEEGEPVFLGPQVDTVAEAEAFVQKNFAYFFDHYLEQWCTDESFWPAPRTRTMFKKWFAVRIHSWVEDVIDAPLELE
jgi:hypothetical protein